MENIYTYLMFDGNLYKIGQTKDIKARLSAMYTASPYIQLIGYSDKITEKELHNAFSQYRVKLEWFNLFDCQVDDILHSFKTGRITTHDYLWYKMMDRCKFFKKFDSNKVKEDIHNEFIKDLPKVKSNLFNAF
jgi:hypothetical protein